MPKGIYRRGMFSKPKYNVGSNLEKFMLRVDDETGPVHPVHGKCWQWFASTTRQGYGQYRGLKAHRVSWEFHVGPIPEGMLVLHKCDNTSCVNPDHLFLGTSQDNLDDMHEKGRQNYPGPGTPPVGERNPKAKLTEDQVREIRRRYVPRSKTNGAKALSKEFGVSETQIYSIVNGNSWSHVK